MKVIISHDVDHLTSVEHLFDGVQLKLFARSVLERMNQVISADEYGKRIDDLFKTQWHHIDELMDFDKANKIPSTFFFAMTKGKGLNYSQTAVMPVIKRVMDRGFDVGVHGIDFQDPQKINSECLAFKEIFGKSDFGIRMHYLRMDENTLDKFDQNGFCLTHLNLQTKPRTELARCGNSLCISWIPMNFIRGIRYRKKKSRES